MFSILVLVSFIKISIHYSNALVLAIAYTLINTVLISLFGTPIDVIVVSTILTLSLSWLFFWLLDKHEESSLWWLWVFVFPIVLLILGSVIA